MNQRYWLNTMRQLHLNDIGTISELKDFVRLKSGSWSAKNGFNDDKVMALVWALMILHEDIVGLYFDIVDKDQNGKPAIIKSIDYNIKYYINPSSIYANEAMGGDALPSIMTSHKESQDSNLDDLINQGWSFL